MRKKKCPKCGGTNVFYDPPEKMIDRFWPKPHCLDCENKPHDPTKDVIDVSGHEETTVAKIAARYLIGRTMVQNDRYFTIMDVEPRPESRMALRVILDNGSVRTLYLPSKIELVPVQETRIC